MFEIFGKKLNKSKQNSCWELPELSLEQKRYAGMDAAVLISILLKNYLPEIVNRVYKTTFDLAPGKLKELGQGGKGYVPLK